MISNRHLLWPAAITAAWMAACGGKVVMDRPDATGGGGATSATSGSGGLGGAGGAGGCKGLWASVHAHLTAAQACDPAIDAIQCSGAVMANDGCGCIVVANDLHAAEAKSAQAAFEAWVDAGCGPHECYACPPPPPSLWYCDPTTAQCQPEWKD